MKAYLMTPQDHQELIDAFKQYKDRYDEILKEGYSSGAEQDGHHDEGFQLSKRSAQVLQTRLEQLQLILNNCKVVVPEEHRESVHLGSGVIIEYEDGLKMGLVLSGYVGNLTNNEQKKVSIESPLGKALIGRKEGEEIEVKLPGGATQITIKKILLPSKAKDAYVLASKQNRAQS